MCYFLSIGWSGPLCECLILEIAGNPECRQFPVLEILTEVCWQEDHFWRRQAAHARPHRKWHPLKGSHHPGSWLSIFSPKAKGLPPTAVLSRPLPAATTEPSPLICRDCHLLPTTAVSLIHRQHLLASESVEESR
jgi:hypothetical protein